MDHEKTLGAQTKLKTGLIAYAGFITIVAFIYVVFAPLFKQVLALL